MRRWALVVMVAAMLASCGGESDTTSSGQGSTSSILDGGGTEPSASSGSTATPATTRKKAATKVAYPGGGPPDPMFPLTDDAYGLLKNRQCTKLLQQADVWEANAGVKDQNQTAIDLYRGAAEACLGKWDAAAADLAKVKQEDASSCDRQAALRFLREMVAAHAADPSITPDTSGTATGCPDPSATTSPSSSSSSGPTGTSRPSTTSTGKP
jgi:hypothetical protein